jgi:hypothetical protein
MARTIGVVTVARSDYGHLVPILEQMRSSPSLAFQLFVGGSHLSERFGRTVDAIEADGWPIAERVAATSEADAPTDGPTWPRRRPPASPASSAPSRAGAPT